MQKKGKTNICINVDQTFADLVEKKASKLQLNKQSVTVLLLGKWLADEVRI